MTREFMVTVCPDPQMLSAYLDGKLDPTERGRIEDHISRCEDCYFVVRETALVWAEAGEETPPGGAERETPGGGEVVQGTFGADTVAPTATPAAEPPVADPRRPKASSFSRYFLPMAATLVVAAGALALWRQSQANADPRAALVTAVGERRFFDARLTGGFKYGERISPTRGAISPVTPSTDPGEPGPRGSVGPGADDWEVLAAAAKIRSDIGVPRNARESQTLAAAHFVLGQLDEAVRLLEGAVNQNATPGVAEARLFSDLAAAYLTRAAADGRSEDYPRALEQASRAAELDPNLPEALYNRALALEALSLKEQARAAWDAYLKVETDDAWRSEAERRIGLLARPAREQSDSRPPPGFDPGSERRRLDRETLAALAARIVEGQDGAELLARALAAAARLEEATGETAMASLIRRVENQDAERRRAWSLAYLKFVEGVRLFESGKWVDSQSSFLECARPGRIDARTRAYCELYVALVAMRNGEKEEASRRFASLSAGADGRTDPFLAGRIRWAMGLAANQQMRPDEALAHFEAALEHMTLAQDGESITFLGSLVAETLDHLGDAAGSWKHRTEVLSRLGSLRNCSSRFGILGAAGVWSTQRGWYRTASALLDESLLGTCGPELRVHQRAEALLSRAKADYLAGAQPALGDLSLLVASVPDRSIRSRLEAELAWIESAASPGSGATDSGIAGGIETLRSLGADSRLPPLLAERARRLAAAGDIASARRALLEAAGLFESALNSGALRGFVDGRAERSFLDYIALADANDAEAALDALYMFERSRRVVRQQAGYSRDTFEADVARAQARSLAGTATLVIAPGAARSLFWLFSKGEFVALNGPSSAVIESSQNEVVAILRARSATPEDRTAFEAWHRVIIGPVSERIKDAKVLEIVAPGSLARVSVALGLNPSTQEFVFERLPVLYRLGLSDVSLRPEAGTARVQTGLLAVGVNRPADARLPTLSSAEDEAAGVAAMSVGSMLLTAERADRTAVLDALPRASLAHFAGHLVWNRDRPYSSYLALAPGPGGGRLLARDLTKLDLSGLRVATLAACEGAATHDLPADQVAGFVAALLSAGVREVVANLWPSGDTSQDRFFSDFYGELDRGIHAAQALAAAQSRASRRSPGWRLTRSTAGYVVFHS